MVSTTATTTKHPFPGRNQPWLLAWGFRLLSPVIGLFLSLTLSWGLVIQQDNEDFLLGLQYANFWLKCVCVTKVCQVVIISGGGGKEKKNPDSSWTCYGINMQRHAWCVHLQRPRLCSLELVTTNDTADKLGVCGKWRAHLCVLYIRVWHLLSWICTFINFNMFKSNFLSK